MIYPSFRTASIFTSIKLLSGYFIFLYTVALRLIYYFFYDMRGYLYILHYFIVGSRLIKVLYITHIMCVSLQFYLYKWQLERWPCASSGSHTLYYSTVNWAARSARRVHTALCFDCLIRFSDSSKWNLCPTGQLFSLKSNMHGVVVTGQYLVHE